MCKLIDLASLFCNKLRINLFSSTLSTLNCSIHIPLPYSC